MRKVRIILVIISAVFLIGMLFTIDFENFLSKSNIDSFGMIFVMILIIFNMIYSNRHERKNKSK